jgi:hypothetical protein
MIRGFLRQRLVVAPDASLAELTEELSAGAKHGQTYGVGRYR